jgi:GNAT superfamily N-acetyltransferase
MNDVPEVSFRGQIQPEDAAAIEALVAATGFFDTNEIIIARELVEERLEKGSASGYDFVLLEAGGELAGYTCYGRIPLTQSSFDLYWIAVQPHLQGRRLGQRLLAETERRIAGLGGAQLYIETASRAQYEPTRQFYLHCGYHQAAFLPNFYAPGDGKLIYAKVLSS